VFPAPASEALPVGLIGTAGVFGLGRLCRVSLLIGLGLQILKDFHAWELMKVCFIVFLAQRPRKVHENGKIGTVRSEEIEYSMEKSRPFYCLIRSVRVERIIGRCLPLWERR
jgi:hypothetical protein